MNPHLLAALGRERRRAIAEDYARALRTTGEAVFRLGVTLDERVTVTPAVESRNG